jgi:hypothetical protein
MIVSHDFHQLRNIPDRHKGRKWDDHLPGIFKFTFGPRRQRGCRAL